jgi:hypothetical protein
MSWTLTTTASPSALCLCASAQLRLTLPRRLTATLLNAVRRLAFFRSLTGLAPAEAQPAEADLRILGSRLSTATRRDLGLPEPPLARQDTFWRSPVQPWL